MSVRVLIAGLLGGMWTMPATAQEGHLSDQAGLFHIEARQTEGRHFEISVTPMAGRDEMEPVNAAGLHLSCILILDMTDLPEASYVAAARSGGTRYCAGQFGADHIAETDPIGPLEEDGTRRAQGECVQGPA